MKKVVQEGKEGEKERKILIAYYDNIEVKREVVEEKISQEPQNRIIDKRNLCGTTKTKTGSRGSPQEVNQQYYQEQILLAAKHPVASPVQKQPWFQDFEATAYTHTGNRTKTGVWPKRNYCS